MLNTYCAALPPDINADEFDLVTQQVDEDNDDWLTHTRADDAEREQLALDDMKTLQVCDDMA